MILWMEISCTINRLRASHPRQNQNLNNQMSSGSIQTILIHRYKTRTILSTMSMLRHRYTRPSHRSRTIRTEKKRLRIALVYKMACVNFLKVQNRARRRARTCSKTARWLILAWLPISICVTSRRCQTLSSASKKGGTSTYSRIRPNIGVEASWTWAQDL